MRVDPIDTSAQDAPQREPTKSDAKLRANPWITLIALLAAPVAASIVSVFGFSFGVWVWVGQADWITFQDLQYTYVTFGIVLVPLGGLLVLIFRRRAPFSLMASVIAGTSLGALVGWLVVLITPLPGENYPSVPATIALSAVSGLAAGLTFWLICRLGTFGTDD